jgi:hypothetical protein
MGLDAVPPHKTAATSGQPWVSHLAPSWARHRTLKDLVIVRCRNASFVENLGPTRRRIERRERLVEKQHLWLEDERTRKAVRWASPPDGKLDQP